LGEYPLCLKLCRVWEPSLGTVTSASHRELQCHLHNPDIESRMVMLCYDCGDLDDSDNCVIDPD